MLNVLGICLWIVAVSGASLSDFAGFARTESQAVIGACRSGVSTILREWQQ